MSFHLDSEIARFRSFGDLTPALSTGRFERIGPDIVRYLPHALSSERLSIGFLALVHGNEVVGLPLLNSLMTDLAKGLITTEHELYFGLGNLPAAYANKRFIEKDLNRCFGQSSSETAEDRRAREIETHLLNRVDYLIDFHQTIHPTLTPFFIFQYSSALCFDHLAQMNLGLTAILQFDAIGDSQHLSTDEYLRSRGGFGVALELGQIGNDSEMHELGRRVALRFLNSVAGQTSLSAVRRTNTLSQANRFFEITNRYLSTVDGAELLPHWQNFRKFEVGELLAAPGHGSGLSSTQSSVIADQSGFVLFPKLQQKVNVGAPLFHVCQILAAEKLSALMKASNLSLDSLQGHANGSGFNMVAPVGLDDRQMQNELG